MNDQELVVNYQPFPGNVPGEGYIPVTTKASQDPPSTSDHWRYEKLTQVTDADKEQIQTNKTDIADLKQDVADIETELADKSEVSGVNDGTNWTEITINGTTKTIPSGGGGGFTPTQAQLDAMNSGIDSTKVGQISTNADDIDAINDTIADIQTDLGDKVDKETGKGLSTNDFTTADKTKLDGIDMSTKQDVLSTAQLNAVNSGITAAKVAEIDDKAEVSGTNDGTNWTNITINGTTKAIPSGGGGGGFTPTQTQLDAMNSGIDSTKVAQIATNTTDIALKANTADINGSTGKLDKTTAVQSIAVVSSMPASPDSTTLYIVTGA